MANDTDDYAGLKGDERIIAEAKKRFKYCEEWESDFRKLFIEDLKFFSADADNGWQWPNQMAGGGGDGDIDEKPKLTVNKTRVHCLQIINDAKQNKASVKVKPTGGGATVQSAKAYDGVIRHIEYISNAQAAYDTATEFQVKGGIGYWRIVTDYADDQSFDQEIFIRRVRNPLSIYLDPDITEIDGSDARFGFVFEMPSKDKFREQHPGAEIPAAASGLQEADDWVTEDHVRVAEYFCRTIVRDKLVYYSDPVSGKANTQLESEIPEPLRKSLLAYPTTRTRNVERHQVKWYKIAGDRIIERGDWPGQYIPIVRVVGEETIIEQRLERKGHVRPLKDPQRMYNYWTSSATHNVALQGQSPFVAPAEAIEGYETYWNSANVEDHSVLPYNGYDENGNKLDPPQRSQAHEFPQAFLVGMQVAEKEFMMASGQYQSQMGENENAKTGKAIAERQRQGDNATYHFIDNHAIAIRFTGKQLIDLIPKIYDTRRQVMILQEDGTEQQIEIDPQQGSPLEERSAGDDKKVSMFNPARGKYDVQADVGPAYSTRRQEAWNALTQIATMNNDLMMVIGDLLFRNADFPGAEEIAERMKHFVPAQAKGGPAPDLVAALEENKRLQGLLTETMQQIAEYKLREKDKTEKNEIAAYNAESQRLKQIGNAMSDLGYAPLVPLIAQMIRAMSADPTPGLEGDEEQLEQQPLPTSIPVLNSSVQEQRQ